MAPMTRSRADSNGLVGELTVRYYVQRASAGLVITEATNVSPDAVGSPLTPGIWNAEQVEAWKKVTSAVHAAGGTIVMQLWHTGRVGHSEVRGGRLPVAPSAIAIQIQKHFTTSGPKDYEVPRALTTAEVRARTPGWVLRLAPDDFRAVTRDRPEVLGLLADLMSARQRPAIDDPAADALV